MTAADEPFVHPALFYRDRDEYLSAVAAFVREGLVADEPVAVAVPRAGLELLRGELGGDAGAVRFTDMEEAGRNPGRIIPRVLRAFADAHPGRRVRIVGEPVWAGRSAAEYPACVQHEALINHAFTGRAVTILCPYDASRLPARAVADAHATHPLVIDGGRGAPSASYAPDHMVAAYNRPLPPPPRGADVLSLRFDDTLLPDARHLVVTRAAKLGLAPERWDDLALAVAELTANSVEHGGGRGTVRVWAEGGRVVWEVSDGGHIRDPLAGRRPARDGVPGGRGLLLVHALSDLVRTYTGPDGTVTRCHLRCAPSP
ncbi:anti-sigma factor RsbA family regulatory protein [Streptomyces caatingaensis]|uniref:Anti-sigma regulatory factor n=1 Tax=Streptomyces caatingaensis TaxID=1678637 RepID=A0A0K9XC45_9ACTN|nr:anti-sigma factor RsbA family regulatory protein [Streptomyces caatingaensis]KNB50661.1 anti-sigma regulatory factor [Streptomyces caatingaensis]